MPLYTVTTEKFGNVLLDCTNIKEARRWAKQRFGVRNPSSVRRVTPYKHCAICDSAPCICAEEESEIERAYDELRYHAGEPGDPQDDWP